MLASVGGRVESHELARGGAVGGVRDPGLAGGVGRCRQRLGWGRLTVMMRACLLLVSLERLCLKTLCGCGPFQEKKKKHSVSVQRWPVRLSANAQGVCSGAYSALAAP